MERMGWEGFMQMERRQLRERCEGKLRTAMGVPLAGETKKQLDRIGEQDRLRAEQGLVSIVGEGGKVYYKHIDYLSTLDMRFRTASEWVTVGWLKERVGRRKQGADAPPVPKHLLG
jgi:hypothetical protein